MSRIDRLWDRHGETVEYYVPSEAKENEFGNPEYDWDYGGTVRALVVYGSAEEIDQDAGEYNTDRPLFYFHKDEVPPEVGSNARVKRIEKDGRFYELQGPLRRKSHVKVIGKRVREEPAVDKYPES